MASSVGGRASQAKGTAWTKAGEPGTAYVVSITGKGQPLSVHV